METKYIVWAALGLGLGLVGAVFAVWASVLRERAFSLAYPPTPPIPGNMPTAAAVERDKLKAAVICLISLRSAVKYAQSDCAAGTQVWNEYQKFVDLTNQALNNLGEKNG